MNHGVNFLSSLSRVTCWILVIGLSAQFASAAEPANQEVIITLTDGSKRQGIITSAAQADPVDLKVSYGRISGMVHLERSRISSITPLQDPKAIEIAQLRHDLQQLTQETDAPQAWQIAQQLRHLDHQEFRAAARKVIELAPQHQAARASLGYQLHDGEWLTEAEHKRAQGYHFHNGKWHDPASYQAIKAEEEAELLARAERKAEREADQARRRAERLLQNARSQPLYINTVGPVGPLYYRSSRQTSGHCGTSAGSSLQFHFQSGGFSGKFKIGD